jgi:hypothetical protein
MKKKEHNRPGNKPGDATGKQEKNAGSASFNEGVEQDPNYDDGTKVSDEEKKTGHSADLGKQKENPKDGNIGKNNAGGYK